MFRIDDPSAVGALPTPEAAGTEGYFTEGNPGVQEATLVRASWLNMIQEELRAIVVAAGLSPSKTTYNQLLTALRSAGVFTTPATGDRSTKVATTQMFADEFASSINVNGYAKRPDGLVEQWGSISGGVADGGSVTFPIGFPTECLEVIVSADRSAGVTMTYGTRGWTQNGFTVSAAGSGTNSLIWTARGH